MTPQDKQEMIDILSDELTLATKEQLLEIAQIFGLEWGWDE